MSAHLSTSVERVAASRQGSRLLWVPRVCFWLLLSATFSLPGRTGPESLGSLDAVALFKVGTRGLSLLMLTLALLALRNRGGHPTARLGFTTIGVFVVWAVVSCLWSPLPAFSIGQAMTLATLFLLAVALALAWRSVGDTSAAFAQLSLAFLTICTILLVVRLINPEASGLLRVSDADGDVGLFHPTMAGGTASLGLVLVVACRLIWNWRWTRVLLVPALVVFPAVMFLAASRTALVMAIAVLGITVLTQGNRRWLGALALVGSFVGILYPLADPGLEAVQRVVTLSADYARRGESSDTLRSLTGRTALWTAIEDSFLEAPVFGHGYFVTSSAGRLDVWSGPANRSAHNVFLQVAVSTGLVGLVLFVTGLWRVIASACRRLGSTGEGRQMRMTAAVLGLWYLGWGMLSESFMGPLSPEAVLAFSLLGLMSGFRRPEAA